MVCDRIDLDAGRELFIYLDVLQVLLTADGRGEDDSQNRVTIVPRVVDTINARPMVPYATVQ